MDLKTVETYDYSVVGKATLQKRRRGNPARRKNPEKYKDLFCAFDIETTNDLSINQAYMYIWQFQIEDQTIIGRTWDSFLEFMELLKEQLNENEKLMIYVHNLSFEFSFFKGIYEFAPDEVFAIDRRKVLKCSMMEHFEFRCSYLLTNMSLAAFTAKMGVTQKLSGEEFDYSKIRYPWTELSDRELEYCVTDVKALVEALKVYFKIEGDNFYTIPYTSTGFVRRDVKRAMRRYNHDELLSLQSDFTIFEILREAFRGGNTHCNRYYTGQILEHVSSYDRVSSYPDVQINDLFPMSPWIREENPTADRVCRIIYKQHRAGLMRVGFTGIRLKDPLWGCPYIPKHKCRNLSRHDNDNGRILDADYLEISLTDLDFKIIMDEYDFDQITFYDFYHCRYGKLPKPLREEVQNYFKAKTELKNVDGQELYYHMAKAKLNSIYGMSVQSPVKQSIDYIDDQFIERNESEIELLQEHNKRAFLVYAWGIWTTAHARYQLEIAIKKAGNSFVYCDTDSVKLINDGSVSFDDYNEQRKKSSIKNGGVATDLTGKKYYLGLYDYEGTYKLFSSMGAKKYCYVDSNDKLHITIAGVGKVKGAQELAEHDGIDSFKEGFTFYKAGGTESVYNDDPEIKELKVGDNTVKITSNVLIKDSTYTLGITGEYRKIILNPAIWIDIFG